MSSKFETVVSATHHGPPYGGLSWLVERGGNRLRMWHRGGPLRLYLDDIREPPGEDYEWLVVRDIQHAKAILATGQVTEASLDHDLGACEECTRREEARRDLDPGSPEWGGMMPHCSHVGTGYDLCVWMAETGHWPKARPRVHSMNIVGAERMRGVIARYWRSPQHEGTEAVR